MDHRGRHPSPGRAPVPGSQRETPKQPQIGRQGPQGNGEPKSPPGKEGQVARYGAKGSHPEGFGLCQKGGSEASLVNQPAHDPEAHVIPDGMVEPGAQYAQRHQDEQPGPKVDEARGLRKQLQQIPKVLGGQRQLLGEALGQNARAQGNIFMEPLPQGSQGMNECQGNPHQGHQAQCPAQAWRRSLKGRQRIQEGTKVPSQRVPHHFLMKIVSKSCRATASPSRFKGP
jgi:hypothetical protein